VAAAVAVLGYVVLERRFPARFGSSCALPDAGRVPEPRTDTESLADPLAEPIADPIALRADRTSGIELTR
jgi:hypothetical protein